MISLTGGILLVSIKKNFEKLYVCILFNFYTVKMLKKIKEEE